MVSFREVVEGAESRHEHRKERREERRDRRHERQDARRVRFGDIVDQAELDSGEAVLEDVPATEGVDGDEASEPWAWSEKPPPGSVRERLAGYRAFLEEWRNEHHDDPVGDPDEEAPEDSGEVE